MTLRQRREDWTAPDDEAVVEELGLIVELTVEPTVGLTVEPTVVLTFGATE